MNEEAKPALPGPTCSAASGPWEYLAGPQDENLRHNAKGEWQYQTVFFLWRCWPPKPECNVGIGCSGAKRQNKPDEQL